MDLAPLLLGLVINAICKMPMTCHAKGVTASKKIHKGILEITFVSPNDSLTFWHSLHLAEAGRLHADRKGHLFGEVIIIF